MDCFPDGPGHRLPDGLGHRLAQALAQGFQGKVQVVDVVGQRMTAGAEQGAQRRHGHTSSRFG